MRTDTRTDANQWQAINVLTDLCVGWFPDDLAAYQYAKDNDVPVSVLYRPKKKRVKK